MSSEGADLPDVPDEKREAISLWIKERMEESERSHNERIELLRTAGEHPSPIFSKLVRTCGELGLSKHLTAKRLSITQGIIDQHYKDDYELGAAEILIAIAANMNRKAISDTDPAAAKIGLAIMERRGGPEWLPPSKRVELTRDTNKAPIIDSSKLTFEQRAQLRAMIEHVQNGGQGDPEEDDPLIE